MQIEGSNPVRASRAQVWAALNSPEVLARCVPGVKTLTLEDENTFKMLLEVSVGPVKGKFDGKIEILERHEPDTVVLKISAKSPVGIVNATGTVRLEEIEDVTQVHWVGEPKLMGVLASIGGRLIEGVAKQQAEIFFGKLEVEAQKL
jgi:uncharacterized protein